MTATSSSRFPAPSRSITWLESHREWLSITFGTTTSATPQGRDSTASCQSFRNESSLKQADNNKKAHQAVKEPIVGFSYFTLSQSKLKLQQPVAAMDCLFEVLRKHEQLDVQVLLSQDIATYLQMKMLEAKTRYNIALCLLQYPSSVLLSKRCTPLLAANRNSIKKDNASLFSDMSPFHQALTELEYCHGIQRNCKNLWQQNESLLTHTLNQQLTFDNLQQEYQETCEQLAMLQCKRHNPAEAIIKYNEAKDILVCRLEQQASSNQQQDLELQSARLWFHLGTLHYKAKFFKQARDAYRSSLKLYCFTIQSRQLLPQDEIHVKQMKHRTGIKSNMYASCSMNYWIDRNSV